MYHNIKTILYHGTVSEIGHVDVTLGRARKDFGKGFYMAVSKKQAIGMMHKKYKEAIRRYAGKADDDTVLCLKAYWAGLYGETGTIEAMEVLLKNLETDNLGIQYFIGKQNIADKLIKELKLIDWR